MSTSGTQASPGGGTLKTIIIGVLTTVLGTAAVYYLGFHENGDGGRKKATETALRSVFQYEQFMEKAMINYACNSEDPDMESSFLNEIDQVRLNMQNIKNEKDVDNRVLSIVDRRMSSLQEMRNSAEAYFQSIKTLAEDKQIPEVETQARSIQLQVDFTNKVNQIAAREKAFIRDIYTGLDKDYHFDFKIEPLNISVTEESLAGRWLINKYVKWEVKPDHGFTWDFDQQHYEGQWSLKGDTVHLQFSHPETATFKITRLYKDFLVYQNLDDQSTAEACRK